MQSRNEHKRALRVPKKPAVYLEEGLDEDALSDTESIKPTQKKQRRSKNSSSGSGQPSRSAGAQSRMGEEQVQRHALSEASTNVPGKPVPKKKSPAAGMAAEVADMAIETGLQDTTDDDAASDLEDGDDSEFEFDDTDEYIAQRDVNDEGESAADDEAIAESTVEEVRYHVVSDIGDSKDDDILRFRSRLERTLELLQSEGKTILTNGFDVERRQRSMTFNFAQLLSRTAVSFLMRLFLGCISLENQSFLGKISWSEEDFMSLNVDWRDLLVPGIYGGTAVDSAQTDPKLEQYVGSSKRISDRVGRHSSFSERFDLKSLPERERSAHYLHMCKDTVTSNYHVWAKFDFAVAEGYLHLLEGIFMIILGTYQDPKTSYHNWNNKKSYDFVAQSRSSAGWPAVQWKGLNRAFVLYQGFQKGSTNKPSPCCNPVCGFTAYPRGYGEMKRYAYNSEDPLGGFLCNGCGGYRFRNGKLPDAVWTARRKSFHETRAAAGGADAACDCCGRLESNFPKARKRLSGVNKGEAYASAHRKHAHHPAMQNELFCRACYDFIDKNNRKMNAAEIQEFLSTRTSEVSDMKRQITADNAAGRPITCSKCGISRLKGEVPRISFVAKFQAILCQRCSRKKNP
ncbi:hypothetical protein BCIN_12g04350 [Botrytis cinerea B05.10]|uniref:Uncharacterized protein n=1 Tax=Botryotinia fuckeliana (strain B05.10) TaxID=332648 RepID=A0A384JZ85_BOTFB|nr:hypothetical protein BCIN_12g04350 [Botrytis cinerea B05.10]ATZ55885.1 hypothetical protein BCIN_12g04350 [Botrytis cinerea B05.10]